MSDARWHVGWAKVDITGEPWGVGMMGYGMPGQRSRGILTRQWARAFVFSDGTGALAYVVADIGMFFQAAVDVITDALAAATSGRLNAGNVVLTATHTHCGPGGHGRHVLYNITTVGHHRRTFDRLVDGVVLAVLDADAAAAPTHLLISRGELHDASVNRSPSAFDRNPDTAAFPDRIDPAVTLVRAERDGQLCAAIEWFAVHCTSMSNTNRLISSDNKGWAASAWEREATEPGFVAAFAQTNSGDMSPNLGGRAGHGPTDDERTNTIEIGRRQLLAGQRLAAGLAAAMAPKTDHRLTYVDFSSARTASGPTGKAVLGAAFAAGTTDGVGSPLFHQGLGNRVGPVSRLLYRLVPALAARQAPKELVLPVGALGWVQQRLPVQLVRLGDLYLLCLPVEVTVTAGARLRTAVAACLGAADEAVLVQGYANGYAHYLTTEQEYDEQRYEGGSTIFGRHQLAAFTAVAEQLARDMAAGRPSDPGGRPRRFGSARIGSPTGAIVFSRDRPTRLRSVSTPRPGKGVLVATFDCAHPNRCVPDSYARVERFEGRWVALADDDSPQTEVAWRRRGLGFRADVLVDVRTLGPGRYRVGYANRPGAVVWAGPIDVRG